MTEIVRGRRTVNADRQQVAQNSSDWC